MQATAIRVVSPTGFARDLTVKYAHAYSEALAKETPTPRGGKAVERARQPKRPSSEESGHQAEDEPQTRDLGPGGHGSQPNLPAPQRPSKEVVIDPEDDEVLIYRRAARKFHPERQWNLFYSEVKRACGLKGLRGVAGPKLAAWMTRSGLKIPR